MAASLSIVSVVVSTLSKDNAQEHSNDLQQTLIKVKILLKVYP
jgi:hypothetical protein